MIQVSFGYSPSPNYRLALVTAEKAATFTTNGEGRDVCHVASYHFADFPQAARLLELVGKWKSAAISCDGQELAMNQVYLLRNIFDCWSRGHDLPVPEAYCRPVRPRPHQPEDEIQRALTRCRQMRVLGHGFSWLEHGYVTLAGGWAVDKEWLRGQVENELWRTRADLCPLFDRPGLEKALTEIPAEFDHSWIVDGPKAAGELSVKADNVIQFRRR